MDIDRDNFLENYPKIKNKLKNATFIAIDEEMTGIMIPEKRNSKLDDADSRFNKMIHVANRYSIVQLGLSIFEDDTHGNYTVSAYNFYLFPNNGGDVVMSTSSIDFLRKNDMNFQKWIGKGLTFVDTNGQKWLEKKYNQLIPESKSNDINKSSTASISTNTSVTSVSVNTAPPITSTSIPTTTTTTTTTIQTTNITSSTAIETPSSTSNNNNNNNATNTSQLVQLTKPSDIEYFERNIANLNAMIHSDNTTNNEYIFEGTNSYLRRAVYKYLDIYCPSTHFLISRTPDLRIRVQKVNSTADLAQMNLALQQENTRKFHMEMGFRLIFNDLIEYKKPIIGHNCMFDLMFLMRWLDQLLEEDMMSFKQKLHSYFPIIYDTKYIATSGIINGVKYENTVLEDLYVHMTSSKSHLQNGSSTTTITTTTTTNAATATTANSNNNNNNNDNNNNDSSSSTEEGEADMEDGEIHESTTYEKITFQFSPDTPGYSVTTDTTTNDTSDTTTTATTITTKNPLASPQKYHDAGNKMFMMQSLYHMNLNPSSPNSIYKFSGLLFALSNFPSIVKNEDLYKIMSKAGFIQSHYEFIWIDGTSLFISMPNVVAANQVDILTRVRENIPSTWIFETMDEFNESKAKADSAATTTTTNTTTITECASNSLTSITTAILSNANNSSVNNDTTTISDTTTTSGETITVSPAVRTLKDTWNSIIGFFTNSGGSGSGNNTTKKKRNNDDVSMDMSHDSSPILNPLVQSDNANNKKRRVDSSAS